MTRVKNSISFCSADLVAIRLLFGDMVSKLLLGGSGALGEIFDGGDEGEDGAEPAAAFMLLLLLLLLSFACA